MAAEVPVSDVLCEAMEYLSKLGSNLRTRSENLKEKRIRKDKLKNSHAVQKAASKVLLICELSKKSLDNVEAGVRQVLSLLEASQAPIGGKNFDIAIRESKHKYHYFDYQSRKLRIAKKIHLKHYMSVKVQAKGMTASMQEKYPVYYDCKLKRHRRKVAAKLRSEIEKSSDNDNLPVKTIDTLGWTEENKVDVDQKSPRPIDKCTDLHCDKEQTEIEKDSLKNLCADKTSNKHQNGSDSDPSDNSGDNLISMSKKLEQKRHSKTDTEKTMKKKSGRIRIVDIYSSDSNEESEKFKINQDTKLALNAKNKDDFVSDNSNHEPKGKKCKLTGSDNSKCQSENLDSDKIIIDKEFSDKDFSKHDSENDSSLSKQGSQNDSGGESKPVIRCVNLSKLLKPDILNKNNDQKCYHKKVRRKEKIIDDDFWAQKRKEVSEFKPKNFSINITRLPTLSVDFLLSYNLKKITKGGKVICKVSNESDTPNSKKMKAVKNALLNDSESDDCRETHDAMKVKKSLLKDSDSEHKISDEEHINKNDKRDSKHKGSENENPANRKKSDDTTVADNLHSKLDFATNNESQEDNCHKTPRLNERIDEDQNQVANEKCYVQSNENDPETSTKINQTVKSALLNDLSDEDFAGFNKNDNIEISTQSGNDTTENQNKSDKNQSKEIEPETPTKINQAVKSSLLNDSSDDNDFAGFSTYDKCSETPTEINNRRENDEEHSVVDQGIVSTNENELETPTKVNETTNTLLLNNSLDDPFAGFSKTDAEDSTRTNENIKTSLLNDSSDETCNKNKEESPTKINEKVKSTLLNDSSEIKSDSSNDEKERQKTPKSKRKMSRKCREAKQRLRYSSSDSEPKNLRHKHSKKKALASSSSSSEDIKRKKNKTIKLKINSDSSNSDNKTIGQVDGAADENSSSSVKKVRK